MKSFVVLLNFFSFSTDKDALQLMGHHPQATSVSSSQNVVSRCSKLAGNVYLTYCHVSLTIALSFINSQNCMKNSAHGPKLDLLAVFQRAQSRHTLNVHSFGSIIRVYVDEVMSD